MGLEKMILQKLDDLCFRLTKLEEKMDNHLKDRIKKARTRREIMLIAIAIISTATAIYQVIS
jgi:hypothetical protein